MFARRWRRTRRDPFLALFSRRKLSYGATRATNTVLYRDESDEPYVVPGPPYGNVMQLLQKYLIKNTKFYHTF